MKFFAAITALAFAVTVSAQNKPAPSFGSNGNCLFPNGPNCVRNGKKNAQGLIEFVEPANSPATPDQRCCVLPASCGNGDGGVKCIFAGKERLTVIVKRFQA
ncbi:hypothetical protein RB595_006958 [Gaeumannomyces hyphopodioides]